MRVYDFKDRGIGAIEYVNSTNSRAFAYPPASASDHSNAFKHRFQPSLARRIF
ncbi:hypothetical protein BDZ89DRAFT_1127084 [Hymenopellis radicata]|nr:hypothetical protein BDZ89DRAFT_1127084 [Hymenopellis radicata]